MLTKKVITLPKIFEEQDWVSLSYLANSDALVDVNQAKKFPPLEGAIFCLSMCGFIRSIERPDYPRSIHFIVKFMKLYK
jgi:hypothetical protein